MTSEQFEAARKGKGAIFTVTCRTTEAQGELEALEKAGKIKIQRGARKNFNAAGQEATPPGTTEIVESSSLGPGWVKVEQNRTPQQRASQIESLRKLGLTKEAAQNAVDEN